ncbi:alanine racemase [Desulfovibrio sp. OttesenSCG-928-C06]|nr:alanine racemase [Desulfovibrio sp. OttesenSCG-928-C06]
MIRPIWAEVSLPAIAGNMMRIKSLLAPGVKFCPVIKADGYGHGALRVAGEAMALGVDYLAVALLQEALELRGAGFRLPVLVLGYTPPEYAPEVVWNRITQTIYRLEQAEALSAAAVEQGATVKVHVKVDSGMSRLGVPPEDAAAFCQRVAALPSLELEGVFTHFATADDTDKSGAELQFARFSQALDSIAASGLNIQIRHCANSAATLEMPHTHLDMVRPGIILYGLNPTGVTCEPSRWPIELEPAMSLKARLAMVKDVDPGVAVSYGWKFVTERPSRLGTLPIGYADGYTRMLSGKAEVVAGGKRAPLVGRICMDQCMVDLTGIAADEGDEVLLFGGSGGESSMPVDVIAARLDTINYEIVCMVGKRVPRKYLL